MIWLYLQKAMDCPCDLDLWPMKVIRPIVTKFGTLIKHMSRTGLYQLCMTYIFFRFLLTILCEMVTSVYEFYMFYNFQILTYFVWRWGIYEHKLKFFYGSVFVIWLYFQKARYRPCDLHLWPMKVNCFWSIEYNTMHVSIPYTFQIDISSNSREIKYQNIGRTHRHTCRQTDRPGENNTSQPPPGAR